MLKRMRAELLFSCGSALLDAGHPGLALWHLANAARIEESNPDYFFAAALAASRAGDRDQAVRFCELALELDPNLNAAYEFLAGLFMHGENYRSVLERLHRHLRPRTYVEIGVETGASLCLVQPGTVALGVDPQPVIAFPLPEGVRIFSETSDDFFARHDVRTELGGLPIDLALIDGMHQFEHALRDFINLERLCGPDSIILIHDCFPLDRVTSQRERVTMLWSGDIWRLVVLLKKYRPDLSIDTIAAPPTGLGMVRGLDPSSRFLQQNLQPLCEEFLALDYSMLAKNRAAELNLFPNDWEKIRALLSVPVHR
jgi:tetratricopeptide (TPR) repeat protein